MIKYRERYQSQLIEKCVLEEFEEEKTMTSGNRQNKCE